MAYTVESLIPVRSEPGRNGEAAIKDREEDGMSESKHTPGYESRKMSKTTPGPWRIVEYGDDDAPALVIHHDYQTRICFMAAPGSLGDPARIAADARLIAAAPEMLAALKELIEFGDSAAARDMANAAIVKATMVQTRNATTRLGGSRGGSFW
jgi:hypothetical protein